MTTDLTTLGGIEGTLERPKALDPNDLRGTEGITSDEIQLPRLSIAQGLSPQLVPGEGKFIKGLTIGEMFNDVTEEIYGNGPLIVIPIIRQVKRIEFDMNDRKVPVDRNVPPGDDRLDWHGEEPPRATTFVEFVCLLSRKGKEPEPVVVSIKTTNKYQSAAAKLWTTYIASRRAAIYSGLYKITSKIEKGQNKKGEATMFGVFIVKNSGFIPIDTPAGAALFNYAKGFYESLQGKDITLQPEEGDEDISFPPVNNSQTEM